MFGCSEHSSASESPSIGKKMGQKMGKKNQKFSKNAFFWKNLIKWVVNVWFRACLLLAGLGCTGWWCVWLIKNQNLFFECFSSVGCHFFQFHFFSNFEGFPIVWIFRKKSQKNGKKKGLLGPYFGPYHPRMSRGGSCIAHDVSEGVIDSFQMIQGTPYHGVGHLVPRTAQKIWVTRIQASFKIKCFSQKPKRMRKGKVFTFQKKTFFS